MISSLTSGSYESAVSMTLIPSSAARRKTLMASFRSLGGPQTPLPVILMAPKPRRLTGRSPPMANWPACAAGVWAQSMFAGVLMISLLYSAIESSIRVRSPKLPFIAISFSNYNRLPHANRLVMVPDWQGGYAQKETKMDDITSSRVRLQNGFQHLHD